MKPVIEPLNIPQDKLDELKALFANPKQPDLHKSVVLKKVSGGACLSCGSIPSHIVKYKVYGMTKIEKYCQSCLERLVTNKTKVNR